jgi:replication factor C subunit 1
LIAFLAGSFVATFALKMDIRNFFAKKKPAPKVQDAMKDSAGASSVGDAKARATSNSTDAVVSARQKQPPKSTSPEKGKRSSSSSIAKNGAHGKKRLKIIDSDDDGGDIRAPLQAPVASAVVSTNSGKRKLAQQGNNVSPSLQKTAKENVTHLDESGDSKESALPENKAKKQAVAPDATAPPSQLRSSPRTSKGSTTVAPKKPPPNSRAVQSTAKLPLDPIIAQDSFDANSAAPMCLSGTTFCFTGILSDLPNRDDAVEMIKILGGRVTGNVSSKADFLVLGEVLEDGRSTESGGKYKRAVTEASVTLIHGAAQFYGLLQQYSDKKSVNVVDSVESSAVKRAPGSTTGRQVGRPTKVNGANGGATNVPAINNSDTTTTTVASANPYSRATKNPYAKKLQNDSTTNATNPYLSKSAVSGSSSRGNLHEDDRKMPARDSNKRTGGSIMNQLWVDKHKPTHSSQILGNQDSVRKLSTWLGSWEDRFNAGGSGKVKSFSSPNGPWKAALLSGPPGIGSKHNCMFACGRCNSQVLTLTRRFCSAETTTATLVANEAGRDVIEYNASDVRSKKALKEEMGDITGSCTLEFRKENARGQVIGSRQKRCIIMDEVDGMGAGDRSGMAELIQLIKTSRVPIICICNDRQSTKMKSLLPYCMDLRYRRPTKSVIATRAVQIAKQEGLLVEQNAAEAIVESCGNDVRQVLNCLQMWSSNNNDAMTYRNLKERERSINKDEILRVSLFDAARVIVEGRKGLAGADKAAERSHFFHRNDAYFVDYNFVGLLVQQNYLKVLQPSFNDVKRQNDSSKLLDVLDRMHDAAQSMSDWAVLDGGLHGAMNWSLLPATAALAVKTGYHAGGESGCVLGGFPEFTTWLGRNSSRTKKARIMGELNHHMNYKISAGTTEMRMSYLPLIREVFLSLLNADSQEDVQRAIEMMDEYGLDRDDVFEKLDEFNMDPKSDGFQKIDSKKKAAFTRLYNQGSHKSQALVAEQGGAKKSKRKASTSMEFVDPDLIDDDKEEDDEEENGDDDDELDAEKIKAMFQKKGRAKTAAPRKAAASTRGAKVAAKPRAKPKAKAPPKR